MCADLVPEAEEVAARFEEAFNLYARCHHICDSSRVLKEGEIVKLGE